MKHINNFKIFEADEKESIGDKSNVRSERVLTQAQKEYKENPNIQKNTTPMPSIVFTDVVGSSKMWSDDPITMIGQLEAHHKLVDTLAQKNNGWIVKTIGDAFMVYFEPSESSLYNAIKFSKELILTEKAYNLMVHISQYFNFHICVSKTPFLSLS